MASEQGNLASVKVLLAAGADKSAKNKVDNESIIGMTGGRVIRPALGDRGPFNRGAGQFARCRGEGHCPGGRAIRPGEGHMMHILNGMTRHGFMRMRNPSSV